MVEIRLVKHLEEIEQLVDLFRVSFNLNMSPELWHWKYIQTPFVSDAPEVVTAIDNSKIVGARPFQAIRVWLDDERIKTAQHCDTMVHPEYRNRGIFNRMNQFAIRYLKENDYILSYGFPALMSRSGFLKQGWRVVAPTEVLFRVVHPQKLITQVLQNKFLDKGLGLFCDKFLNTRITEALQMSSSFQVEVFDQFTEELKDIDSLRDKLVIDLVRDEEDLQWRFDCHPEHSYKYVLAKRNDELWGYFVISIQEQANGLVYGMIVDYLVKGKDITCFRILASRSLTELEKSGCDMIVIWVFSEPKFRGELLRNFNFKSSIKFPYNRFFTYGYLDALLLDEQRAERTNIYDKNKWRITYAYSDNA